MKESMSELLFWWLVVWWFFFVANADADGPPPARVVARFLAALEARHTPLVDALFASERLP